MTSIHEPVLHALSVEPRVARPGETVCVIFRTRNLGTSASPPGTVTFLLGDGLEALAAPEIAVEPTAPGEDVVATLRVRVVTPLDDRTELAVQAVLHVPDAVLATNVCALVVRSRPVLDGDASGTFVESIDADSVRVRAIVTNEGDGAARDVRVRVPAPAGCVRADGDGPAMLEMERLEVGASVTAAFDARIVEPVAVLAADDGEVCFEDGRRCALPVREVVVVEPVIATPCVAVRPSRRAVDVAIDVRNDGWADARDVRVRVGLPAPLRAVDGSIVVDGVPVAARGPKRGCSDPPFARVERSGGTHVVVMPVAAQTTVRIACAATFPGGFAGGTIVAGAGAHEIAVPFVPELVGDVRMRLIDTPRIVRPGGALRVVIELVNAGDAAEELFFCIAGDGIVVAEHALPRTIAPGSVAVVELAVRARETARDDDRLALSVVACDAERERARATLAVSVRDRLGACGDESLAVDTGRALAAVHAVLRGPADVSAGACFAVRADIDVEDDVERLIVRVRDPGGAAYVAGSTSLAGRPLLDRAGVSPLAGYGLLLRAIPAGTRVTVAWNLLADANVCDEALVIEAALDVDGEERACAPVVVHVRGRDAFVARPTGLPYHVDACVVEPSDVEPLDVAPSDVAQSCVLPSHVSASGVATETAVPENIPTPFHAVDTRDDAFTFTWRLDDDRLDEAARFLHGAARGGLVAHVLALRVFFPDGETSDDRAVAAAVERARTALRDVFDRLYVKLRIPGFDVVADDLDDAVLRCAMTELFGRLLGAAPGDARCDDMTVRITRERAGELLSALTGAPYGSPAALRALVALLPTRCGADPLLGGALARYACALDDALARYEGVPLELFDDALARASDRALDEARDVLAAALRERTAVTELAC